MTCTSVIKRGENAGTLCGATKCRRHSYDSYCTHKMRNGSECGTGILTSREFCAKHNSNTTTGRKRCKFITIRSKTQCKHAVIDGSDVCKAHTYETTCTRNIKGKLCGVGVKNETGLCNKHSKVVDKKPTCAFVRSNGKTCSKIANDGADMCAIHDGAVTCKSILKVGKRKGEFCGCLVKLGKEFCVRHNVVKGRGEIKKCSFVKFDGKKCTLNVKKDGSLCRKHFGKVVCTQIVSVGVREGNECGRICASDKSTCRVHTEKSKCAFSGGCKNNAHNDSGLCRKHTDFVGCEHEFGAGINIGKACNSKVTATDDDDRVLCNKHKKMYDAASAKAKDEAATSSTAGAGKNIENSVTDNDDEHDDEMTENEHDDEMTENEHDDEMTENEHDDEMTENNNNNNDDDDEMTENDDDDDDDLDEAMTDDDDDEHDLDDLAKEIDEAMTHDELVEE